jgi:hypothetical protein
LPVSVQAVVDNELGRPIVKIRIKLIEVIAILYWIKSHNKGSSKS